MILLELNEYNGSLLRDITSRRSLGALQQVFAWRRSETRTDDAYDSGFLEPWVQWVSVHTGNPSSKHQIKHLGDVPALEAEQVWERWSREGRRSIVWGVMNGDRRTAQNCDVFIPDPWTFSEPAYPDKYSNLIRLPRYLAKNYLDISKLKCAGDGVGLFSALLRNAKTSDLKDGLGLLLQGLRAFGPKHIVFIVFFEYMSAMAFLRSVEERQPDNAIVFINMFAHAQHHYWKSRNGEDCPELEFAARAIDGVISKLIARTSNLKVGERICIMNALSQKCTDDEPPWVLHRPKNPECLLQHMGLNPVRVEPLMTHDAHAFFADAGAANAAFELLKRARVNGAPLFHVERSAVEPSMLFYRLDFFDLVDDETTFVYGNSNSRFNDHFISIVTRTGKHIQKGEILANWDGFPSTLYNHEAVQYL